MPDNMNFNLIGNGGDLVNNLGGANSIADPNSMRPYIDTSQFLTNGKQNPFYMKPCITVFTGGDPKKSQNYRQQLAVNATTTLRKDEWKELDEAVLGAARERLGGIEDLRSRGLTKNLQNAMATTIYEWDDSSDGMEAVLDIDPVVRGKNDDVKYQRNGIPIPVLHVDYEILQRALLSSRRNGQGVDTTKAEQAGRRIAEFRESMLFTSFTYGYGDLDDRSRNSIYSYLTFPDRNQVTLGAAWDDSSTTAVNIKDDVIALKAANIAARHYGEYILYVPKNYESRMDDDYNVSGASVLTIRERLLKLEKIVEVKVNDLLPDDNVVLVQMTSSVVRLIEGLSLQNIQWPSEGGFKTNYKALEITVPQLRSDQNGRTGIAHGTV